MSNLSRRSLVTSAAALPALAIPAVAAAAVPNTTFAQLADQICAKWDRFDTFDRDIEESDCQLLDALDERLWSTPSASISDLAAKARVLDKRLRINGKPHSVNERQWDLVDDLLALAVRS
jgi:hypothetical protein